MRYKHISQKPYCCVPACVQMIFRRRKLPTPTQSEIGYALGMILPPTKRGMLSIKSHTGKKPAAGWGTRINQKKYSLQAFFNQNGLSLIETFYPADHFRSKKALADFLKKSLKSGDDLLTCFNYPLLYGKEGHWGHASLIDQTDSKGRVILVDPGREYDKPRAVTLDDYYSSIKNHPGGGIWLVSTKNKKS